MIVITSEDEIRDVPEPTDDSTVDEVLEYVLVTRLSQEADLYKEALFEKWERHFDELKQEIVRISHEKENEVLASNEAENCAKGADEAAAGGALKKKKTGSTANKAAAVPIRVVVHKGFHAGQTFHLQCAAAKPCLVGRSKQAKYKKNGISLHGDLEMSTSHGQIGLDAETLQPYVADAGYVLSRLWHLWGMLLPSSSPIERALWFAVQTLTHRPTSTCQVEQRDLHRNVP